MPTTPNSSFNWVGAPWISHHSNDDKTPFELRQETFNYICVWLHNLARGWLVLSCFLLRLVNQKKYRKTRLACIIRNWFKCLQDIAMCVQLVVKQICCFWSPLLFSLVLKKWLINSFNMKLLEVWIAQLTDNIKRSFVGPSAVIVSDSLLWHLNYTFCLVWCNAVPFPLLVF